MEVRDAEARLIGYLTPPSLPAGVRRFLVQEVRSVSPTPMDVVSVEFFAMPVVELEIVRYQWSPAWWQGYDVLRVVSGDVTLARGFIPVEVKR